MNPNVAKVLSFVPVSPVDCVWFDITDSQGFYDLYSDWRDETKEYEITEDIEDMPLPFDDMGIVMTLDNQKGVPFPFVVSRKGNTLSVKTYMPKFNTHVNEAIFTDKVKNSYRVEINPEFRNKFKHVPDMFTAKAYDELFRPVMTMLTLLSYGIPNKGVEVIGYRTTPSSSNEKRIRKGKQPLFDWKTIALSPSPVSSERVSLGGTHSSPRPHDRRGHQRRYKSGKVVYVKSTTINRHKIPTEGFIHHDYKVKESANGIQK